MPSLPDLVKSLSVAFDAKDYESCKKLLTPIKIELLKNNVFLPDPNNQNEVYINDLNISKKILEIGALVSINSLELESFQNYFDQLRLYYFSNNNVLSTSENKSKLVSLYMLILLSQGDVSKFHSELEFVDKHIPDLKENDLLSYPIELDRWLMEGSYQKAWDLLKAGSKVAEFDVFTKTLMDAIREEIACNTELSYSELPLTNVKTLLFFNSEKEAEVFGMERGWKVRNGNIYFKDEASPQVTEHKSTFVLKTLDYAINLESIV
ncbi:proteasome regulatory particle lid subunit RPN12 NDAI_0B06340 [Naumovozyma dairenensis CBS 421]|uniref:PCI domain-containing protein n=1 Tax=Naumovozyma dairenensis (strain ATCC 10597 / BCRC 20456 / CBS 421 / NBRC 0211 / NRRL Y-12639) TaxID=1071378 RepID=G0W7A4_NAUDC|nr:hypothetical protein NDAI_0B06340 [Naumovozyma dairenensis CBS 421]CCD23665.1 hypothetical protein NDAI_0B06340 [Naumovozyma dairenensis CBS 421]